MENEYPHTSHSTTELNFGATNVGGTLPQNDEAAPADSSTKEEPERGDFLEPRQRCPEGDCLGYAIKNNSLRCWQHRDSSPPTKASEEPCICHYNPENGYRLDIVCPKHDTPVPPPVDAARLPEEQLNDLAQAFKVVILESNMEAFFDAALLLQTKHAVEYMQAKIGAAALEYATRLNENTTLMEEGSQKIQELRTALEAAQAEIARLEGELTDAIVAFNMNDQTLLDVVEHRDAAQETSKRLAEALDKLDFRYRSLVYSGDCGSWNPEDEDVVIETLAALTAYRAAAGEQEETDE